MNPLLIRRRGMMQSAAAPPADGQLEWIETDGVAYIDTGYTPNNNSGAIIRCLPALTGSSCYICGCRNGTSNRHWYLSFLSSGNASFGYANAVSTGWPFDGTKVTTFKIKFTSSTSKSMSITPDGGTETVYNYTTTTNTPSLGSLSYYIFAMNYPGGNIGHATDGTKIYSFEIYTQTNLVESNIAKRYLPWRLNGEVGLMDVLTNTFYGNVAGSGAFTGGPNVI